MGFLRGFVRALTSWAKGVASLPRSLVGGGGGSYVILAVVGGGLIATVALVIWYTQTHRPLTEAPLVKRLPGVADAAQAAPPFIFAIYGLVQPMGVATSQDGTLIYAADSEGPRLVHVFDRSGKELATLAPPNTTQAQRRPARLAVSPDGKPYVADILRGEIDVYGPDRSYQGVVRPVGLENGHWQPLALAFDRAGNLLVAEATPGSHRVLVLDGQGRVKGQFGRQGKEAGELSFPNGLAVDDRGLVYVSDSSNARMQVLDPRSGFIGSFRSPQGSNMPRGVAVAGNRLYVADTIGQIVSAFALEATPRFLFAFGGEGQTDGQFLYPESLAVDPSGRIYVADRENNRIQVFGSQ